MSSTQTPYREIVVAAASLTSNDSSVSAGIDILCDHLDNQNSATNTKGKLSGVRVLTVGNCAVKPQLD